MASLLAQLVKNLPAMQKTPVPSLGWEDPGGGRGNPLQYSCLENPHGQRSLVGCRPCTCKESGLTEQLSTTVPGTRSWLFKASSMKAAFYYSEEVSKEESQGVWVHLLKMSRIGKSIETKYISGCLELWGRGGKKGNNCWWVWEFFQGDEMF